MRLEYKRVVLKQLKRLSEKERKKVFKKLEQLLKDPGAGKVLRGEFLGLRALRAWPYRIVYEWEKERVVIYSIARRQGVYR